MEDLYTADDLRARNKPFPVKPGRRIGANWVTDEKSKALIVRRPDVRKLIYNNQLPVPILAKVGQMIQSWVGQDLDSVPDDQRGDGPDALALLDTLLTVAMVEPRAVVGVAGAGEISLDDMDTDFKERIFFLVMTADPEAASRKAEQEDADRFREDRHGEGDTPDVPGVLTTA